jgi:hypothetical protein
VGPLTGNATHLGRHRLMLTVTVSGALEFLLPGQIHVELRPDASTCTASTPGDARNSRTPSLVRWNQPSACPYRTHVS